MKVYLNALGVINPLGKSRRQVAGSLFEGSRAGLVLRHDLLSERAVRVGEVPWQLAEVPSRLAHLDCRNNRLALTALLAKTLDVPKKAVAIRSGAAARIKRVQICGDPAALSARLAKLGEAS